MSQTDSISLSRLQAMIKTGIEQAHPSPYWVTAEISELNVNHSGHCYLELVEKGGANHIPKAKANAVIWCNTYAILELYFRQQTGRTFTVGLQVLLKVVVSYHELYGLSLQVIDLDPAYTLGDMERQRQETIARLQSDGVFEMNRDLELPVVIQRLAVVSSRNAAGYQDFCHELSSSSYLFEVTLFDAFMQGTNAEDSVIEALDSIAGCANDFDAVVMIRGGGSQSDLGCFDSYRLCSHVAQFPLPIIVGIGHDKDQSVTDLVSAVSVKTPTAVAVYLKERVMRFDIQLDEWWGELSNALLTLLDECRQQLHQMAVTLKLGSSDRMYGRQIRLEQLLGDLVHLTGQLVDRGLADLCNLRDRLSQTLHYSLMTCAKDIDMKQRLLSLRSTGSLQMRRQELMWLGDCVDAREPQRMLGMGFALVRSAKKNVTSAAELQSGAEVTIQWRDGSADAKIKQLHLDEDDF